MTEAPIPTPTTNQEKTESLNIEQDNKKYLLIIKIKGESIDFIITDPEEGGLTYSKKMTLREIQHSENHKFFLGLNSCYEFSDYLKILAQEKKIWINKKEGKLSINFIVEFLLKKHPIDINLYPEKYNLDLINNNFYEELCLIKEKIKNLENQNNEIIKENKKLKEENNNLKEEINKIKKIIEPINKKYNECININKYIFNNKSVIMKDNEFDMIHFAIKSRLNKEVKELKKLYQATIDGDGPINFHFNFHSRCDNIPNTLTIIKSAGNRRFGGFTTQVWDSSGNYKDDKNAFLFSLDKQKIYPFKNNGQAIYCYKDYGPTFGCFDIHLNKHPIQEKNLYTYESCKDVSYIYNGDNNALSEDGRESWIFAVEYEVFQIIFS